MSGTTLFLLGAIAISNISLLVYLLSDRNKKVKAHDAEKATNQTAAEPSEEKAVKDTAESQHKSSRVGRSTFNIDDLEAIIEQRINEKVEERVNRLMVEKLGDVHLKDVEFANDEDKPTDEEISSDVFVPKPRMKDARMSKEQEDASFDDVRIEDVDADMVSAPSANGASMEEIEKSINDAINPDVPAEDKIEAGKVLEPLLDTNLIELFTTDADIFEAIKECITQNMKEQVLQSGKQKRSSNPTKDSAPIAEPAVIIKRQTEVYIAPKLDDFNPADLLP